MYQLSDMVTLIDAMLNTKRKRHIVGGALISASLLFGGLAITVMTFREEKEKDEESDYTDPDVSYRRRDRSGDDVYSS